MTDNFWAHTPPEGSERGHSLKEHLSDVAELARQLAKKFGAGELGYYAGLWHDLGKYNPEFQEYLQRCHESSRSGTKQPSRGPRHAIYGAILAAQVCRPLAPIIYGHHAGLQGFFAIKNELSPNNPTWQDSYQVVLQTANEDLDGLIPAIDWRSALKDLPKNKLSGEVFLRMLFSCLVDADYLDTEEHFEGAPRQNLNGSVADLWQTFEVSHRQFLVTVRDRTTPVNQVRDQVYQACINAAENNPGIFSPGGAYRGWQNPERISLCFTPCSAE